MTPEDRVYAAFSSIEMPCKTYEEYASKAAAAMRQAIRAAENDALERVAAAFSVGTGMMHRHIHPQDVADRIRSMKHADE